YRPQWLLCRWIGFVVVHILNKLTAGLEDGNQFFLAPRDRDIIAGLVALRNFVHPADDRFWIPPQERFAHLLRKLPGCDLAIDDQNRAGCITGNPDILLSDFDKHIVERLVVLDAAAGALRLGVWEFPLHRLHD